jgi:hypothetical protein
MGGRTTFATLRRGIAMSLLALVACGGTTGRFASPIETGPADATVPVEDLDGGPFDVNIMYVDRILPDVTRIPVAQADAGNAEGGADGAPMSDWPCPADIIVPFAGDAACGNDADGEGGCDIAAAYDDAGHTVPAPAGSICAMCAPYTGGAGCTPTEQLLIEHDPSGQCYNCMAAAGALDDVTGDVGNECSDFTSNSMVSAEQATAFCLNTLRCILGPTPNAPTCATGGIPTYCYCGATNAPAACAALTPANPPNGACAQVEVDGLQLPLLPNGATIDVLKAFEESTLGSGLANLLIVNSASNMCSSCYQ